MKKLSVIALTFLATTTAFAQKDTTAAKPALVKKPVAPPPAAATAGKKDWSKVSLANRPNDHLMVQIGYDGWAGTPDTVHLKGFSRSFNIYFMFDFPFKTDPRFSIGAGLGIGSSNIFFDHQIPRVAAASNQTLAFPELAGGDQDYKKNKLVTTYLQIPVELRFAVDPEHTNSTWKFAVGTKIGTMLSAYTKQKTQLNSAGQTILSGAIQKESSKKFFNSTQLVGTARITKGFVGLFGQFQVTSLIKGGAGANINPWAVGITFSGL